MTNTPQIDLHEENIEKKTIRRQHCKYFINITSIEQRFQIIRTVSKTFTFKTTHKNAS